MNHTSTSRRDSLRRLSHIIGSKLYRLGISYLDRGSEIPIEFVERVFDDECRHARLHGGPLKSTEIRKLQHIDIPKALHRIEAKAIAELGA